MSSSLVSEVVYPIDNTNKEGRHTTTTTPHSKTYTAPFMVKMVQGFSFVVIMLQWIPDITAVVSPSLRCTENV